MPGTTTVAVEPNVVGAESVKLHAEEPKVLDTYSLVYAFVLLCLVPSMVYMLRLPFGDDRSLIYTFEYVSAVTVPFLLGLILTFVTDSRDRLRTVLVRILVLTPLTILTGVTVMFGSSMIMLPASKLLGIRDRGLSVFFWVALAVVAAPLFPALWRRLRRLADPRTAFQAFAIASAIALVVGLTYFSLVLNGDHADIARKDAIIYIVGALTWYAPSFGISAGIWRRSGLV